MDIVAEMLTIAASLGVFNYVLGSLIYSLPIPLKGIKKWGPYLIQDGILTFSLAMGFYIVVWSVNHVYSYLGLNREEMMSEILRIAKNVASLYIFLSYITEVIKQLFKLKVLGFPFGTILEGLYTIYSQYKMFTDIMSRPLLDMFMNTLRIAMYTWTMLYVLSRIMELLMPFFIASGILLIGIPFRIAKSAGAFLFSASIVGYVMGPLIIVVLNLVANYNPLLAALWNTFIKIDLPDTLTHVSFVNGRIVDEWNKGVPYSIVRFCDLDGMCGIYTTDQKGNFITAYSFGGIPWPRTHIEVEVLGINIDEGIINLKKLDVEGGETLNDMTIKLRNTYLLDPGLIIRIEGGYYEFMSEPSFHSDSNGRLYFKMGIKALTEVNVTVAVSGVFDPKTLGFYLSSSIKNPKLIRNTWYGINVWLLNFTIPGGKVAEIVISGQEASFVPPETGGSIGYLAAKLGVKFFQDVGNVKYNEYDILMVPFFLTALPLIHMTLISMTTYGLASLISGGVKRLSIRVW